MNKSSNQSLNGSPAIFRRLNKPPQVQLNLSASKSTVESSNNDLKNLIENLPKAKDDQKNINPEIIDFKDQDFSVLGALGAGAGMSKSLDNRWIGAKSTS